MILSKLTLSPQESSSRFFSNPYEVHRTLYNMFDIQPPATRDFLYWDQGTNHLGLRVIIMTSKREPRLPDTMGQLEIRHLPPAFLGAPRYRFQVRINPVRRDRDDREIPVLGPRNLLGWFADSAPSWGFVVSQDPSRGLMLNLVSSGVTTIGRGKIQVPYNEAVFSGVLDVTDREKFISSVGSGIGRHRAFGFGLIQVFPVNQ